MKNDEFRLNFPDLEQIKDTEKLVFSHDVINELNSSSHLSKLHFDGEQILFGSKDPKLFNQYKEINPDISRSIPFEIFKDFSLRENTFYQFIKIDSFSAQKAYELEALKNIGKYFIIFKKNPSTKSRKFLELYRRTNFSGVQSELRNYESEKGLIQSDELLEKIILGEESLFSFHLWFYVSSEDIRRVRQKSQEVLMALGELEIKGKIETIGLSYAVRAFSGKLRDLKFPQTCHTSFLVNLLPLSTDSLYEDGYDFLSKSNKSIKFELFNSRSNSYGVTISGATGQGKSKFGNKLVFEELQKGAKVVVLDRNGSYRKMCKYVGGVELSSKFNPLFYKDASYIKELLISVIPLREQSKEFEGRLYTKLTEIHFSSMNSIEEILDGLGEEFSHLRYYFAEIIENFNADKIPETNFLYVDFDNYPSNILAPLLIYIIWHFYSLEGKKLILMDECHHLLKNNVGFVEKLFRELRKQMGSPIALTQNYSDFVGSEVGRVIAANSFYNIFFHQNIEESSFIDEFDKHQISSLQTVKGLYSEFYLKTEQNKKTLRFVPSKLEYELFTSDYSDNLSQKTFFKHLEACGFEYKKIMDAWVKVKYAMV